MCGDDVCAGPAVNIPVEAVIIDFNFRTKLNDIALIRLAEDVPYSGKLKLKRCLLVAGKIMVSAQDYLFVHVSSLWY